MIAFTLYTANCTGNLQNCLYPKKVVVQDKDSFVEAIRFDHVSAEYKDNYRSNTNFIKADNIVLIATTIIQMIQKIGFLLRMLL